MSMMSSQVVSFLIHEMIAGTRKVLEDQLAAHQLFSAAFLEAAARKEEAIKAHIGTVHLEEVRFAKKAQVSCQQTDQQ